MDDSRQTYLDPIGFKEYYFAYKESATIIKDRSVILVI